MQTFRISKVQEQNYYALRIFGIVHLIAVVGLVVLLDGPGNGLRGITWFLILFLLSSSAFLLVRVFQAQAGRIHGHYVLTNRTLAILLPGQPRMFVHRKECMGLLHAPWKLALRNGGSIPLWSVSARPYFRDMVSGVCKAWWPGFHGSAIWVNLFDCFPESTLNLRIDFRGRPDGRNPLLVYTGKNSSYVRYGWNLAMCGLLFVYFLGLPIPSLYSAAVGGVNAEVLVGLAIIGFLCLLGAVATLKFGLHILRQIREYGTLKDAFVVSGRSLAVLRAGDTPAFYCSDALIGYHDSTGQLDFQEGRSLLAASYLYASPYNGLLRSVFARWRPGQQTMTVSTGTTNPQMLVFFALVYSPQIWNISGAYFPWERHWTNAVGNAVFMLVCFFIVWFYSRKNAAKRVDVSVVRGEERSTLSGEPTVAQR